MIDSGGHKPLGAPGLHACFGKVAEWQNTSFEPVRESRWPLRESEGGQRRLRGNQAVARPRRRVRVPDQERIRTPRTSSTGERTRSRTTAQLIQILRRRLTMTASPLQAGLAHEQSKRPVFCAGKPCSPGSECPTLCASSFQPNDLASACARAGLKTSPKSRPNRAALARGFIPDVSERTAI
jgi:hypothetical protein